MNKLTLILIIGILLRLVLSAVSFHNDTLAYQLAGQVINQGNVFSFYDYLWKLPSGDPLVQSFTRTIFNYPPGIYLFSGGVYWLFSHIFGLDIVSNFLFINSSTFGNPLFNLHLLLLKVPYLLFDIIGAFVLMRLFNSQREKFLAFTLWIFNPVNLYATYLMGQHDIIPTFFVVLSLILALRNRFGLAALALGFGVIFKQYPLYLLLPLIVLEKKLLSQLKLLLIGLAPYLLLTGIYLPSKGFRTTSLFASQTTKSLYAQIPISGGEAILLFPLALLFLYLIFYFLKRGSAELWKHYFLVLLVFFIFTHTHPQWFLWLTPFLIIDLVKSNFKHLLLSLLSLLSFIILIFFFDSSLTVGIFAPVFPQLYQAPDIWKQLHLAIDYNQSRSIFQTVFVAAAVYFIYLYFPREKHQAEVD